MTRKNVTPYPTQIAEHIKTLKRGAAPLSALTLSAVLEHSVRRQESSRLGEVNKALHRLWGDGTLISFVDADGNVLREKEFGRPGSAAAEHPQRFGLPGTPSPAAGYMPMTYDAYSRHEYRPPEPVAASASGGDATTADEPETAARTEAEPTAETEPTAEPKPRERTRGAAEAASAPAPAPAPLPFADDDEALEHFLTHEAWETVPSWMPSELVRDWCTRALVMTELRDILARGPQDLKKLLIPTGLKRKGAVAPDSEVAEKLARLCADEAYFWQVSLLSVMVDFEAQDLFIDIGEWRRFFNDDWIALSTDHSCESVLLTGMRLGMAEDALGLLALEAAEELRQRRESSQSEVLTQDVGRLSTSLHERKLQLHETRDENRELKKKTAELTRLLDVEKAATMALRERLDGVSSDGSEAERELDRALRETHERERSWARDRTALEQRIDELEARGMSPESELGERDGGEADWEERALALESQLTRERAEHERLEQQLQEAYRGAIELKDQLDRVRASADSLPTPDNAGSLLDVLDAAVGAASKEAADHLIHGEASIEDELLLRLASRVIEFKRELGAVAATARTPPPVAAGRQVDVVEAAEPAPALDPAGDDLGPDVAAAATEPQDVARTELRARRLRRSGTWSVRPIGGAGEIGGSAVLVTSPDKRARILLDCGQRIPSAQSRGDNRSSFHYGVPGIEQIDAVLITHAHLDHLGSLPVLYRSPQVSLGRCGILMSGPTRRLAGIMLADSAKLQNARANDLLARAESDLDVDHAFAKPAYDTQDVVRVLDAVTEAPPYEEIELAGRGVTATFLPVAHVLGSCAIRLKHLETGRTLLYTGDLGPLTEQVLSLPDFGGLDLLEGVDIVVMESTYGDAIEAVRAPAGRALPNEDGGRRARSVGRLLRLMRKTIEGGGFVLLPSFALGRSQELARLLGTHWGGGIPQAPLYIAGMGEQILDVYSDYEHHRAKGETQWVNPGLFPRTERLADRVRGAAAFVDVVDEVLSGPPGYILATPATMGGGWSQWFAERLIADERHAVAFTGYVPGGDRLYSLAALHTGSRLRCVDGSRRRIDCAWEKFSLSSHAQRDDLLMFAGDMVAKNGGCRIGVMHGTPAGQASLVKAIVEAHGEQRAISLENNREWTPTR